MERPLDTQVLKTNQGLTLSEFWLISYTVNIIHTHREKQTDRCTHWCKNSKPSSIASRLPRAVQPPVLQSDAETVLLSWHGKDVVETVLPPGHLQTSLINQRGQLEACIVRKWGTTEYRRGEGGHRAVFQMYTIQWAIIQITVKIIKNKIM